MCHHRYRNLLSMYVSSVSVNYQILPFLWDIGALSMSIPMVRLHNSGKFSCGTLFQSQCPSWFWQSHISGCVSNEDISLKSFKGSGLGKWPIGEDGILWDGSSPNIHIFIHMTGLLPLWQGRPDWCVRRYTHCLLWLQCCADPVLAGSDVIF